MTARALPRPPAVAKVLERISALARSHAMFEPGSRVLVAVSGGTDSVCLLHSLVRLRRLLRIEPVCFHFDHRLRPGSAADGAYARRQAERLGVAFLLREAGSSPARGESVEAWARTVRYGALFRAVEDTGAAAAAVAHTMDDQAETVLLALLRGGGLESLTAMDPVNPPVVRPLLTTTQGETEAFCRALRLRPRRDPMNEDPRYMRVAVRREVIPVLEERLGRNVRAALVRTAALLRRDSDHLQRLAEEAAGEILEPAGTDPAIERRLRLGPLREAPAPIAARVIRGALLDLGVVPEAAHVAAVLDLASARTGARISLPQELIASREREYVRLLRPSPRGQASAEAPARDRRRPEGREEGGNGSEH